MRIDRATTQLIRLRLNEPFRISSGTTFDRRILIVKLDADPGVRGYGECVADVSPHYSYETVHTASWVLHEHLLPAVVGRDFETPADVARALAAAAKGHNMAKAAVEMAAWDLYARIQGISLARALGAVRTSVPSGVSIGIQTDVDALLQRIDSFAAEGYRRIKIKIAPGWDAGVVAAVRRRFPELPLMVDANSAYVLEDADRLAALDEFDLMMIEQPLAEDDLLDHAELQTRLRTPICLDESITSLARCAEAIRLRSGRIVNIKPGRVGGLGPSLRIHDLCAQSDIPVWCGGMLESGIGRAHNVALAALPNFTLPGDTSASRRYWQRDVVEPEFALRPDGTLAVPQDPGIGVHVDEALLASLQESETVVSAPASDAVKS